jgi:hypothetical protein
VVCPLAQRAFGQKSLAEASVPGTEGKAVEPFARAGGVRVFPACHMSVMNQTMRAGVLAEEKGCIDGSAEAEVFASGSMDQLMRCGVADLAEPEAGGEKQQAAASRRQVRGTGDAPGGKREECQRRQTHGNKKGIGGGKLCGIGLASIGLACGQRDQLVEKQAENRHVKKGRPKPRSAKGHAKADQHDRRQSGKREGGQRQRTGGRGSVHWAGVRDGRVSAQFSVRGRFERIAGICNCLDVAGGHRCRLAQSCAGRWRGGKRWGRATG